MMISFSGIDSAGKSTQISLLESYYKYQNKKCKVIWGRGSWTPGVELIKKIVRKDKGFSSEQKAEYREQIHNNPKKQKLLLIGSILDLYLYFGIYYRWLNLVNDELICDRYIWDTCADFKVMFSEYDYENWLIWRGLIKFIPKPKRSFMLVIPTEESLRRGHLKQEEFMESEERKREKIKKYRSLIEQQKWTDILDGMVSIDEIHKNILSVLDYKK